MKGKIIHKKDVVLLITAIVIDAIVSVCALGYTICSIYYSINSGVTENNQSWGMTDWSFCVILSIFALIKSLLNEENKGLLTIVKQKEYIYSREEASKAKDYNMKEIYDSTKSLIDIKAIKLKGTKLMRYSFSNKALYDLASLYIESFLGVPLVIRVFKRYMVNEAVFGIIIASLAIVILLTLLSIFLDKYVINKWTQNIVNDYCSAYKKEFDPKMFA